MQEKYCLQYWFKQYRMHLTKDIIRLIGDIPSGTGYVTSTAASKYNGADANAKKYWKQRVRKRLTAFDDV